MASFYIVNLSGCYVLGISKRRSKIDNVKAGQAYESFVAGLQRAILEAERIFDGRNIEVETNKILIDNDGLKRQFDVYWEYEIAGITYRTVIECKDYNSRVSVGHIGRFARQDPVHSRTSLGVCYQEGISIRGQDKGR